MTDNIEQKKDLTLGKEEEILVREERIYQAVQALFIEGYQPHQVARFISPVIVNEQAAFRTSSTQFVDDLNKLKDSDKFEEMNKRFAEGVEQFHNAGFNPQQVEDLIQFAKEMILPKNNEESST